MPSARYFTVHVGERKPGGGISWRIHSDVSDPGYLQHLLAQLHARGLVHRAQEWKTAEPIPTTAEEAAWHARRAASG